MYIIAPLKYFILYILSFYPQNLVQSRYSGGNYGNFLGANQRNRNISPFDDFNLVSVNIDKHHNTKYVKYRYDTENKYHIYTAKPPNLIYKVEDSFEIFWMSENGNYAYRVVITYNERGEEVLKLFYPDFNQLFRQRKYPKPAREPLTKPVQFEPRTRYEIYPYLAILNIKHRFCSELIDYEYDKSKSTHTFEAIQPYLFGLIMKGEHVEWDPKTQSYPNKVLIFPDSKGKYTMRLFFPGQLPMPLKPVTSRHSNLREVSEHVSKKPETVEKEPVEVKKAKEKKAEGVELNVENLNSTQRYELIQVKDLAFWEKSYVFRANDGYKFTEVKSNFTPLWKASSENEYSLKVSYVKVYIGNDNLTIHLNDTTNVKFSRKRSPFSVGNWQADYSY